MPEALYNTRESPKIGHYIVHDSKQRLGTGSGDVRLPNAPETDFDDFWILKSTALCVIRFL